MEPMVTDLPVFIDERREFPPGSEMNQGPAMRRVQGEID